MNKNELIEQYARSEITEGFASMQLCRGDRLAFRELFTIWCLENSGLATELGWSLHVVNKGRAAS